ncbi:deoxyribose-phosphate aldolase [Enterococcus wangshanyuanii]|uniref:Deoxyribose-phosphate aldolase n=1 Tax=Enterococcus wangshanyuanii TaxID=2005703 RepID=A0ABQ1NWS2_9ENTE|nr:deoxyribose-phosphate aldolase [Enterococcus wangshanyuanii]GGC86408.1 deoxyribose-phosphate aldolase [Enterococcus wangshanyuanii]
MNVNKMIDHTLLKPEANEEALLTLIEEAKKYDFASVCVNPYWVALASKELTGTSVEVCTVIGFPLGANTTSVKAFETDDAIKNGATEIDMVINVGALKSGDEETVLKDIQGVVEAAKGRALVKVILETCLLTDREIVTASNLAVQAGADFVKTSTGFSTGGATVKDIALMRKTVGPDIGVKASGGVRTAEDTKAMIHAGASRIGASSSVAIVDATIENTTDGY